MFQQRPKVIYGDEMLYLLDLHGDVIPVTYDRIQGVVIYRVIAGEDYIFSLRVLTRSGTNLWSSVMSELKCRELCAYLEDRHGFRGFESVMPMGTARYYCFRTEDFRVRGRRAEYQDDSGTWTFAAWMFPDDMIRFWIVMRLPPWISRPLLVLAPHWDILEDISCLWSLALSWLTFRRKRKMYLKLLVFCQIVLIVLKLLGVINDSWWGVLIPLIYVIAISVLYIIYDFLKRRLSNAANKCAQ